LTAVRLGYCQRVRYLAVTQSRGPAWDASRAMDEQESFAEHASFMNALVAEGFVVAGGPLGDGTRILLIVDADTEGAVHARLAGDPWSAVGLLDVVAIEPWEVLLGG
jgi:uncharacterized protein YciI